MFVFLSFYSTPIPSPITPAYNAILRFCIPPNSIRCRAAARKLYLLCMMDGKSQQLVKIRNSPWGKNKSHTASLYAKQVFLRFVKRFVGSMLRMRIALGHTHTRLKRVGWWLLLVGRKPVVVKIVFSNLSRTSCTQFLFRPAYVHDCSNCRDWSVQYWLAGQINATHEQFVHIINGNNGSRFGGFYHLFYSLWSTRSTRSTRVRFA